MFKKLKTFTVVLLNVALLVVAMGLPTPVSASEEDFSISSPETMTYTSDVKSNERRQLFNDNWKFIYGDQSNAENIAYDDSAWETLQLPHDYSLTLPYSKQGEAESGYKLGGIGWYRKSFTVDASAKGKRIVIEFGGIYMNASVYINGVKLGDHPNGYTPFAYDLTEHINTTGENIIAVKVDHQFPSSRWYSGSGIYRDVYLTVTDPIHVSHYGVQVLTPELATQHNSDVDIIVNTTLENESQDGADVIIKQSIRNKNSEDVLASGISETVHIEKGQSTISTVALSLNSPTLWSLENPHLYEIVTEVVVNEETVDEVVTDYGFRIIDFDANTGFHLNNKAIKLKGVSMHSDQGSLGAAAHYRAIERQVEILQDMGVNAIRVTHNPAADELIEIANRKGMLIIDEAFDTWVGSKNGNYNDYAKWFNKTVGNNPLLGAEADMTWAEFDIKTMVRRGINAPSIISWSVGNEVMEGNSGPYGNYPNILRDLATWVGEVDQSRPSTIGDNKLKGNWGEAIKFGETLTELNGTVGFNYANGQQFDKYHNAYPEWKMYGAETASSINSRGVYKPSNYDRHLTSYDESTVGWGKVSADSWYDIITRDFMAGEFVWTGFDYLGEPTPHNNVGSGATGAWPSPKSSYFGIVDTAGLPKDRFYFYQSQWNDDVNTLHVLPAWKKDMVEIKDGNVRVDVYSDARSVELFFKDVNGVEKSLGKKTFTPYTTEAGHKYQVYEGEDKKAQNFRNLYLTWNVPYEDGTVYAKGYDENGTEITNTQGRNSVTTFDKAATVELTADRQEIYSNSRDLSYITIDVKDKNGNTVEDANNLMNVSVSGNGTLIALDNGDQVDHEPYDSGQRKAFNGKLVAIVKSTKEAGPMTVTVESNGLETQSITVNTIVDPSINTEKHIIGYSMPKNYYVKLGHQPRLVDKTTLLFSDGSKESATINWDIDESMFSKTGTVPVTGVVSEHGVHVTTNVTIIESVGAILNYSTTSATGVDSVNLPSSRPIVLENGEVLDVEFPVEWEAQNPEDYKEAGEVVVNGVSKIFGETHHVTATIRVDKAKVSVGANVAPNNLTLTQSIPKEFQSDSLEAIVDGNRNFKTVQSGPNDSVWTNYDMAQTGENKAELIFTFATAQFIGEADLYFYQDSWAARLPEDVEMYWSNEGTENATWSKLDLKEIKGDEPSARPSVTKNTYQFNGVPAVGFKIVLTSNPGKNADGKNLAVGLTEAELKVVTSSLVVNKEATLSELLLNNEPVLEADLDRKVINTEYQKATVDAKSDKNAAITVLKPYDNVIRIITESEDHAQRSTYTINLDKPRTSSLPADDGSRDYPFSQTIATAGNYHPNHQSEGHPKFAVDNRLDTIFHTAWAGTPMKNYWITLELEEETKLEAFRYLSRSGQTNGIVKDYVIEVSSDNETWTEASRGTWSNKMNSWSIANFDQPHVAKYVRLTALSTYGDGDQANKFMSAKEIRVRVAEETESLKDATVTLSEDSFIYDGTAKKPSATVVLNDIELEQGIDYRVEYADNIEVGEARMMITGIVKYSGTIEKTFTISDTILNTDALANALHEAKALKAIDYSESSFSTLQTVIQKSEEIMNTSLSQEEIDQALIDLEAAIANLEPVINLNTEALELVLKDAYELKAEDYTEDSYKTLQAVIIKAEKGLLEAVTQEEIDSLVVEVQDVIDNLKALVTTKELEARIEEAKSFKEELYTEESFKALVDEIVRIESILDELKTQEDVDKALESLNTVIEELVRDLAVLDKEPLELLIVEAQAIVEDDYTEESFKALQDQIVLTESLLETATSQDELDEAYANLEGAIESLVKKPGALDKEALRETLKMAESLKADDYTEESFLELQTQIKAAHEVLDSAELQEQLDDVLKVLEDAIEKLVLRPEEISSDSIVKLESLIDEAQKLKAEAYTEDSFKMLTDALAEAEFVYKNLPMQKTRLNVTQVMVDMVIENLENAIANLVPVTVVPEHISQESIKSLNVVLDKAKAIDTSLYEKESVAVLEQAILEAEDVLSKLNAYSLETVTQADVDAVIAKLDDAISGLVLKAEETPIKPEEGNGNKTPTPTTPENKPNTSVAQNYTVYIVVVAAVSLLGLTIVIKKRKDIKDM